MEHKPSQMIEQAECDYLKSKHELETLDKDLEFLTIRICKVNDDENKDVVELKKHTDKQEQLSLKLDTLKDKLSSMTTSNYKHLYDLIVPSPNCEYILSASLSDMQYYSYSVKRGKAILHDYCEQLASSAYPFPNKEELSLAKDSIGYQFQASECIEISEFHESLCSQLLSNVFVCDNRVNALRLYLALEKKYRVVTVHGEIFDRYKDIRFDINNSPIILRKQIMDAENQIEDNNTALERLRYNIERLSKLHRDLLMKQIDLKVKINNRFIVLNAKKDKYHRLIDNTSYNDRRIK